MFQNVNKHWRAHLERDYLERSFGEHTIASLTWTPNSPLFDPRRTPVRPPMEHRWILNEPQLLWIVSSNGLSKWALQCLFTFWNITILDCNSNYLALYSIFFFDTNVYNESWLTYYYQWLDPGNVVLRTIICWILPSAVQIMTKLRPNYDQITMINETQ